MWQRGLAEPLAWALALLPLVAVHLAYALSIYHGQAPACLPYWQGCTSISAAAREMPALAVFRAVILPSAGLLAVYWWLAATISRRLHPAARGTPAAILVLGVLGAVFLSLYAVMLGEDGAFYRLLRRYGINLYFAFTVLAQMLLIRSLLRSGRLPLALRRAFLGVFALLIGLGLASLPLQFWVEDRRALLNALEWSYALLMVSTYPLTAYAWRTLGLRWRPQLPD
jgi:hypothetical protein